jgi:citrate lyase synthetase
MLRKCFPNITIIEVPTGNIQNIAKLLPWQITQLYCGTDRVNDYRPVAEKQHIKIIEIKRTDDDISATKVVQAIKDNDFEVFKSMTPKQVWGMFEELKGILGNKQLNSKNWRVFVYDER